MKRALLSASALALLGLLLAIPGCFPEPDVPVDGCKVGNWNYKNGEVVPSNDALQSCVCADGHLSCGPISCKSNDDCSEGFCGWKDHQTRVCKAWSEVGDKCGGFVTPESRKECRPGLSCEYPEATHDVPGTCQKEAQFCEYGGQTYKPGDSFKSTDGCNTCFCGENGGVGCTKMLCLPKNSFDVERDGKKVEYDSTSVKLTVDGDKLVLAASGSRDPIPRAVDDEYSDAFRMVLDRASLKKLQVGVDYALSATGTWDLGDEYGFVSPEQVKFSPFGLHIGAVEHLYFYRMCFCYGAPKGDQVWKGTIRFSRLNDGQLSGTITTWMTGSIPLAGNGIYDVKISVGFDVKPPLTN